MIDQKNTKIKGGIFSYPINSINRLLIIWMIILLSGYIVSTICFPSIGPDSGFYLKIAYDLHQGQSFFTDMNVAYTPLGMYILSFVFDVFPSAGLSVFYSVIILFYLFSTIVFFQILEHFNIDIYNKKIFTLLLLLSFFILEGPNILMEPFVLFFQLPAVLFILKWEKNPNFYWLPIVGLFCFLSFFSKQYGLSVLFAFIWFLFINKASWKQFFFNLSGLIIGLLFPILLVILYFNYQEVSVVEMIKKLIGINYLTGDEQITGIGYDFLHFLESIGRFLTDIPVLLILIPFAFRKNNQPLSRYKIFILLLILGACIQLIFAGYRHYYQLIVPYCLILIAHLMQNSQTINTGKLLRYFSVLCLVFTILVSYQLVESTLQRSMLVAQQKQNATNLTRIIPSGQKVYLQGISPAYYYLCRYDSPNFKLLGYRFPKEISSKYIFQSLPIGAYIIVDNDFLKSENFENNFSELFRVLLSEGNECVILQKK